MPISAYFSHNSYKMQDILIKLHKTCYPLQGLHSDQRIQLRIVLWKNYLPLRTFKNTDVAIASIILKLFSSNFTHLFSVTRATFWIRAAGLVWTLDLIISLYGLRNSQIRPWCLHSWGSFPKSTQTCLQKHKGYI